MDINLCSKDQKDFGLISKGSFEMQFSICYWLDVTGKSSDFPTFERNPENKSFLPVSNSNYRISFIRNRGF